MPFSVRSSALFPRLCAAALALAALRPADAPAKDDALAAFQRDIQPVLDQYCYDCHGYDAQKGGVKLDGFADAAALHDHKLWLRVLKNVRAGIMPPATQPPLPADAADQLVAWIKRDAFALDPAHPDPGRVTVRRLNRVEYRNTVRALTGYDFDTQKEFPADDTGHGFDNNGDVLTISPMLLEKYLDAAQAIVTAAVPVQPRVVAEHRIPGRDFATASAPPAVAPADRPDSAATPLLQPPPAIAGGSLDLSYYTPATVAATHRVEHAGQYQLQLDLRSLERYVDDQFDLNRCRVVFRADGEKLLEQEFVREGYRPFAFTFDRRWSRGPHELTLEIVPLPPARPQPRLLRLRLEGVTVRGPLAEKYWVKPAGYDRFFPRAVPATAAARRAYARELLGAFASRAFRRPADEATVTRLVALAESTAAQPRNTFEAGIAQAMVAVLASPRFIFREETVEPLRPGEIHPRVDEYALASRLSYFFWSSMPDDELFRLAAAGQLRTQLPQQISRLLADPRSQEFVRNFTGQWLQARDIASVPINALDVYLRENPHPDFEVARNSFRRLVKIPEERRTAAEKAEFERARTAFRAVSRAPKPDLSDELRRAMQRETELCFDHVLREDRSLLELLESDYTFLNEELARHYGIDGVTGPDMRRVTLPPGSYRGGVLTQGTVLAVTSNPTRTSPVKRGVFILDAILGTPPAPPPPNIPALEDAASPEALRAMTLRDTLALHAKNKMCASCHSRMDPLGLALENFNAMGRWRDTEFNLPFQTAGKLVTGEAFADIRELKHLLATKHRRDFYTCLSEKLLTYALGRGLEYYDVDTVDALVAALEASGGRPSALLRGIVDSAPFQQRRAGESLHASAPPPPPAPAPAG